MTEASTVDAVPSEEQINNHWQRSRQAETIVVDCPYCGADVETADYPPGIDVAPCKKCTACQIQQSDVL